MQESTFFVAAKLNELAISSRFLGGTTASKFYSLRDYAQQGANFDRHTRRLVCALVCFKKKGIYCQ